MFTVTMDDDGSMRYRNCTWLMPSGSRTRAVTVTGWLVAGTSG
ncbi:MAG: hypothetical protein BWY59_00901 [Verrucomicrobia bacterium ADurb.Bin345]|nr:MAG: hypothetical protein BWY59_00901 [Verrucomicrobia bacterium ADurb.Bin345]